MNVVEDIMIMGSDQPLSSVIRDEHLLLGQPHSMKVPIKAWEDDLLTVVHFPPEFFERPYAPPLGVYENTEMRIEWQQMEGRQPFYHRNCDVDEISYQIAGERTLMTELGVIEHRTGELSVIPRGVAHDNWGRRESHLLLYVPAPLTTVIEPVRVSERVMPPFPGWEPSNLNECVTECMGTLGHDKATFPIDERQLLDHVEIDDRRIGVLVAPPEPGGVWAYTSERVRVGMVNTAPGLGRRYRRTLDADEIQYQISGRRTLISQRGIVELEPGDFVRIPLGVAYASVSHEPSRYLTLLSHLALPQIKETARTADLYSPERLATLTTEVNA